MYICYDNTVNPITGATRSGLDFAAVCAELTEEFQGLFLACKSLRMNSFAKYDGSKGKIALHACDMDAELQQTCFPSLPTALTNMCKWSLAFVTYNRAAKLVFCTKTSGLPEEYQHPSPAIRALRKPMSSKLSPLEELARQTMQHPTMWEKGLDISLDYADGNTTPVVLEILPNTAADDCTVTLKVTKITGINFQLNENMQPGTSWEQHQVRESIKYLADKMISYRKMTMNMNRTLDWF